MPDDDFAAATAARRLGDDRYAVDLHPGWAVGDRPLGGYTLATVTRAALDAVGRPHALVVSGHFLVPPHAGPAEVETEVLRAGRSVSTVRARLVQDGASHLEVLASAGDLTDSDVEWSAGGPPEVTPVEQCLAGTPPGVSLPFLDHVDVRLDPATAALGPAGPSGEAEVRGWARLTTLGTLDPVALAVVVDVLPPTVFNLGRFGWAPTIELTYLTRGLPEPGWLRCVMRTRALTGGWFDEDVEVWDAAGRLVAQARQLARSGRVPPASTA